MKLFERMGKKITKGAKKEVRKTALDLIPTVIGVASMILGFVIFKGVAKEEPVVKKLPSLNNTSITTNNYFFQEMSEESIRKILEDD